MGIYFDEKNKLFKLNTANTTYIMALTEEGYVAHVYYGPHVGGNDLRYLLRAEEPPYTPIKNKRDKASFLDSFPMEYPTGGVGDYRESCLEVRNEYGSLGCEIFYHSHRILEGKKKLAGLPASFGTAEEVQSLEVVCEDPIVNLRVILQYAVFEKEDIITRSVKIENCGTKAVQLEKVYSACLDMDNQKYEMLSLHGSWARERHIQRGEVRYGKQLVSSSRGESSHQEHPFIALVTQGTTQQQGEVYAMHFVYSGNFVAQAERSQFDSIRLVMGIHPDLFAWNLEGKKSFQTPEVVMTYSATGLGLMTRHFHDFYRSHMIRSSYQQKKRPVLINNWEATYFDYNTEKLLDIAREAKKSGIEMLVMDDGWYGERNADEGSLGDWNVNEKKIMGGLPHLVQSVRDLGMEFGIWFEPEMISPNSNLYRVHPEWAIQIPQREPTLIRAQYVLDLSRQDVLDYVYESVASILRSAPISYLKWDMNRQLCDLGSFYLSKTQQMELSHRYVLGLYQLQERLVTEFPDLLLENCSGGGARFDPGMLYYSPQIWCSDDTDAVERLAIQEGTEMLYPLSVIGAHVSDCPNHTVGRNTPFATRGHVALAGTFGYELDITKISEEDRSLIPAQVADYHKYYWLIREGDYYRIASWSQNHTHDCWMVVSKNRKEVLVTYVQVLGQPNSRSRALKLQGLDPEASYCLEETGAVYCGDTLMYGGLLAERLWGDAQSKLYHFKQIN